MADEADFSLYVSMKKEGCLLTIKDANSAGYIVSRKMVSCFGKFLVLRVLTRSHSTELCKYIHSVSAPNLVLGEKDAEMPLRISTLLILMAHRKSVNILCRISDRSLVMRLIQTLTMRLVPVTYLTLRIDSDLRAELLTKMGVNSEGDKFAVEAGVRVLRERESSGVVTLDEMSGERYHEANLIWIYRDNLCMRIAPVDDARSFGFCYVDFTINPSITSEIRKRRLISLT